MYVLFNPEERPLEEQFWSGRSVLDEVAKVFDEIEKAHDELDLTDLSKLLDKFDASAAKKGIEDKKIAEKVMDFYKGVESFAKTQAKVVKELAGVMQELRGVIDTLDETMGKGKKKK